MATMTLTKLKIIVHLVIFPSKSNYVMPPEKNPGPNTPEPCIRSLPLRHLREVVGELQSSSPDTFPHVLHIRIRHDPLDRIPGGKLESR